MSWQLILHVCLWGLWCLMCHVLWCPLWRGCQCMYVCIWWRVYVCVSEKEGPCKDVWLVCVFFSFSPKSLTSFLPLSAAGISILLTRLEHFSPSYSPLLPFLFFPVYSSSLLSGGWAVSLSICCAPRGKLGLHFMQTYILQSLATYFTLTLGFIQFNSCFGFGNAYCCLLLSRWPPDSLQHCD